MTIKTTEDCAWLHETLEILPLIKYPFELSRLPDNGIYFFYETGELNGHGIEKPRVVRVGTHKEGNFKSRIKSHYLIDRSNITFSKTSEGPKDRSILRKNIGRALLNVKRQEYLPIWEKWKIFQHKRDINFEREIEEEITDLLRTTFTFKYISLKGQNKRMGKEGLESRLIGTLSHCTLCKPGKEWLGSNLPDKYGHMIESGLWLKHYLKKPGIKEDDKKTIEEFIKE